MRHENKSAPGLGLGCAMGIIGGIVIGMLLAKLSEPVKIPLQDNSADPPFQLIYPSLTDPSKEYFCIPSAMLPNGWPTGPMLPIPTFPPNPES